MQRALLNLLLLVAVIGLGTAAYFQYQKKSAPKPKLTGYAPEAVVKAEIAWAGAPVIKLGKQGSGWVMTAPVAARVDEFEILSVTNLASTEVQETLTADELNLKDIGLLPPERTVTLNGSVLAFGATEPLNARRYVKAGGKVLLIDDPASPALDKDYHDLISKTLFAPADDIVALELPGGISLAKGSDGQWPTPAAAKLVQGWKAAKSLYNEAAESADFGERVKLTLKGGAVQEFVVAATDPQLSLYSETLKIRYVLSKELVETLLKLPEPPAAAAPPADPAAVPAPAAEKTLHTAPAAPSLSEGLQLAPLPSLDAPK